jgi:plasmid replication initiation protein
LGSSYVGAQLAAASQEELVLVIFPQLKSRALPPSQSAQFPKYGTKKKKKRRRWF